MSQAGVQYGEEFIPREEILLNAAKGATGLSSLGIARDDTVALLLRNDVAYLEATTAIRTIGALPVPMNWHLRGEEIKYILGDSRARAIIIHSDMYEELSDFIPEEVHVVEIETPDILLDTYGIDKSKSHVHSGSTDWNAMVAKQEPWTEEPALQTASMIYTSGTTGNPKGVRRVGSTAEQYAKQVAAVASVFGIKPGVRTVIPAPMYHAAPNAYALFGLQLEAFMVIMPRFDAEEFLKLIEQHKISHVQMVPTMFVRLLKLPREICEKYDTSTLEYIIHAAAPCPPQTKNAMIEWWGAIIWEYYGSTEMSSVTICSPEASQKYPGTVGKSLELSTVKILDDNGNELPANEIGHVYGILHTNAEFTYQNDNEKRKGMEVDGLLSCGDIGYLNDEGYLFLCDRASNMIISGGANIYPAEIESVLIELDGVHDCAVFGIPDDDFGEKVAAIIELEPGVQRSEEEITAFLRDRIAGYKLPKYIEFRNGLPREDSGKLFKRKLKEPFWNQTGRKI